MVRSRQNEDETVIVAASSEESLTEVRDESHPILSQAFPESGNYVLTQREKLSEVPWWGARHTFAFLAFVGFLNVYAMRVNLSVAIVVMINNTAIDHSKNHSLIQNGQQYYLGPTPNIQVYSYREQSIPFHNSTCPANVGPNPPYDNGTDPNSDLPDGPFVWNESMQSIILGSFFYGYVITQIPAGYLAGQKIVSCKWLFGFGILFTSIFTVLMPLAAKTHYYLLLAIRVLEGLGEGVTFPVMHAMLAEWSPPLERSRLSTYVYSGATIGTVISMSVTGEICERLGWESVFYIFGGMGIIWFIFWSFLAYEDPSSHPYITEAEKDLIEVSLGKKWFLPNSIRPCSPSGHSYSSQDISCVQQAPTNSQNSEHLANDDCDITDDHIRERENEYLPVGRSESRRSKKKRSVPWRHIFTSSPFWAIFLCNIPQTYGFYTLLTELPKYLSNILHYNINEVSLVSALPAAINYIFSISASWIADTILIKQWMSKTATRKLMMFLGSVLPALGMLTLAYLGCDPALFIVMLCLTTGFDGFRGSGLGVNLIDISPNYAGATMGVVNTASNVMGFVAPYIVGLLLSAGENEQQWRIVFLLASGGYFLGNAIYVIFGSGEVQPWNDFTSEREETLAEIESRAESLRSTRNRGPILSIGFDSYDDDLIY